MPMPPPTAGATPGSWAIPWNRPTSGSSPRAPQPRARPNPAAVRSSGTPRPAPSQTPPATAATAPTATPPATAPAWPTSTAPSAGATSIGAILLIAQDTTPGKEFFCWALKTHGGNDDAAPRQLPCPLQEPGHHGLELDRRLPPHQQAVLRAGGAARLFRQSASAVCPRRSAPASTANGHQLRSGIALGHYDFVLQAQGLFDAPPPLIQLPAPLFIGSTTRSAAPAPISAR